MPPLSCGLFPGTFPLALPVELAALSFSHFPQSRTSSGVGWGMGITAALADGFSSSLQCLPQPLSISLPHCPQSVGHLQAGGQSHLFPWGSRQTASPLAGFGSLSSLIAGTLCGCGVLPKATSESRQEKQRSQGHLTEKEF